MRILSLTGIPELGVIPLSDSTVSVKLVATTPVVVNVPEGAKVFQVSCSGEYFIAEDAAAVMPTTTPVYSALTRNPAIRSVEPGVNTLGVVATSNCNMTISFYG